MTVSADAHDAADPRPGSEPDLPRDQQPGGRPAASPRDPILPVCPYLTASGGSWRMAGPSRDHRCGAVDPPAPQPTDKQRRHCLSEDHVECSMFRAAREARAATLAGNADPALVAAADLRRRPIARTAPVLLEAPRLVDQAVRLRFDRASGQIALIALMVVAFAIVALTRLSGGAGPTASAAPSQLVAIASPTPTPRPTPSASPSPEPSPSVAPSAPVTYKVKKGDTLLTIAKKFGTTAAKISALNGLKGTSLKVGQVLKIP